MTKIQLLLLLELLFGALSAFIDCLHVSTGLSIHTFHGNFFVRSTDLLSLPNVNPDAGFAVQMSIEENLDDMQVVSFQAALLYTSSKGTHIRPWLGYFFVPHSSFFHFLYENEHLNCVFAVLNIVFFYHRREEDPCSHVVSTCGQFSGRHLCWG